VLPLASNQCWTLSLDNDEINLHFVTNFVGYVNFCHEINVHWRLFSGGIWKRPYMGINNRKSYERHVGVCRISA